MNPHPAPRSSRLLLHCVHHLRIPILGISGLLGCLALAPLQGQVIEGTVESRSVIGTESTNWPGLKFRMSLHGKDWELETQRGTNISLHLVRKDGDHYHLTLDQKHARNAGLVVPAPQFDIGSLGPLEKLILLAYCPDYPDPAAVPPFTNPGDPSRWLLASPQAGTTDIDPARKLLFTAQPSPHDKSNSGAISTEGVVQLSRFHPSPAAALPLSAESRLVQKEGDRTFVRIDSMTAQVTSPDPSPISLPGLPQGTSVQDVRSGSNYFYLATTGSWLSADEARKQGKLQVPLTPSLTSGLGLPAGRTLVFACLLLVPLLIWRHPIRRFFSQTKPGNINSTDKL